MTRHPASTTTRGGRAAARNVNQQRGRYDQRIHYVDGVRVCTRNTGTRTESRSRGAGVMIFLHRRIDSAKPPALIQLNLHEVNQLFNSMDPSPFPERDLDQD